MYFGNIIVNDVISKVDYPMGCVLKIKTDNDIIFDCKISKVIVYCRC